MLDLKKKMCLEMASLNFLTLGIVFYASIQNGLSIEELGDFDLGCPKTTYLHGNYCYRVITTSVTYTDAEILCETGGGLLATVKNIETEKFLQKLLIHKYFHDYWFGLDDKQKEGEWINADGTRLSSYHKWIPGEPNNHQNNQHCAKLWLDKHLEWDDDHCSSKYLHVCQYDERNCTDGMPKYERNCFELNTNLMLSYDEAEMQCEQRGGHLAMIKTEGTFRFIKSLIYANRLWLNLTENEIKVILGNPSKWWSWINIWIGARFIDGEWMYSDETPVSYANWAPGKPQTSTNLEDCVNYNFEQLWSNVQCGLNRGFICQYSVKYNSKPQPTSTYSELSKFHDQILPINGIHLGVAVFVLIVIVCIVIGMFLIVLPYKIIIWKRKNINGPSVKDDQQGLNFLQFPEQEDQP